MNINQLFRENELENHISTYLVFLLDEQWHRYVKDSLRIERTTTCNDYKELQGDIDLTLDITIFDQMLCIDKTIKDVFLEEHNNGEIKLWINREVLINSFLSKLNEELLFSLS